MFGLIVLLLSASISLGVAMTFRHFLVTRRRANERTLHHVDVVFQKWDVLLDAKLANDSDVPNEVIVLGETMIETLLMRQTPFLLLSALHQHALNGRAPSKNDTAEVGKMRDPLEAVLHDMIHSWIICVSNRNLLIRPLIRQMLGRVVVREGSSDPFTPQVVFKISKKTRVSDTMIAA
jgi:hypothetical protein